MKYLVICTDDLGKLVLASRTVFTTLEAAEHYCQTISPSRQPQVVAAPGLRDNIRDTAEAIYS